MLNVQKILYLKGYEVAEDLSVPEMNSLIDSFEGALAAVYSDYKSRFFVTRIGTLTRMQAVVHTYKSKADRLLDKYKNKIPAGEINRFVLLTAELQYIYAGYVVEDPDLMERGMKEGESELKSLMIYSAPKEETVTDKKIDMNKRRKEILNSLEEAGTEAAKKWETIEKIEKQIEELERKLKDLRDN